MLGVHHHAGSRSSGWGSCSGDQLVDLVSGQDYRFPGCYGQGGTACSGVPDPVSTLDPHGGVDGVAVVTGQLFVGDWTTGIIYSLAESA